MQHFFARFNTQFRSFNTSHSFILTMSSIKPVLILFIFGLVNFFRPVQPAKILFLVPLSCRSELEAVHPLAIQLLQRGHKITWVTSMKTGTNHPNYTEIVPPSHPTKVTDYHGNANTSILELRTRYTRLLPFFLRWNIETQKARCDAVYNHPAFREAVLPPPKDTNITSSPSFDLVILNGNLHNCLFGIIPTLHPSPPPFILFTSLPFSGEEFHFPSFRMPPSFVPASNLGLTSIMTFPQRVLNFSLKLTFALILVPYAEALAEEIYRPHLPLSREPDFPPISQISANVALVFSNSHAAITNPRPVTPDIVEVGCLQCREKVNPLPKGLERWIQGAGPQGVILFSMGSMFSFSSFPPQLRNMLLNVFGRLRERVVLVANLDAVANLTLPNNVLVTPWIPQQDILGHPKLRLFISHGGTQSHLEAAWHGVPVLLLPIWADQAFDAAHVVENGNGLALEILELTEEKFEDAINEVLTNRRYKERAMELSGIFRDQPETPVQRAVYWTEYIIRHKGAMHWRTGARQLNFFQYHCLDVILFLTVVCMGLIYMLVSLCRVSKLTILSKIDWSKVPLYLVFFMTIYQLLNTYYFNKALSILK